MTLKLLLTVVVCCPLLILSQARCSKHKVMDASDTGDTSRPRKFRYLALGDSYTIGESVAAPARFPVQLVNQFRNAGIDADEPQVIAVTGWTTANLLAAMDKENPRGPFNLVTLLIGVNNQYQAKSLTNYREELIILVRRSLTLAANDPNRVLMISIPDYSVTPFAQGSDTARIASEIAAFNQVNLSVAHQFQLPYVNITEETKKASTDLSLLAYDGLHYSAKEYSIWVAQLAATVQHSMH